MKDIDPLNYFHGLDISCSFDGYYLTQANYNFDMHSQANLTDNKIANIETELNDRFNPHDGEPLQSP